MHFSLDEITLLIVHYKYLILFPFLILEGPVVTVIAAFLASPAHPILSLPILLVEVIAADLAGDVFYYCLGRFSSKSGILKWGAKFGLTPSRFQKLEDHFVDHGGKTIAAGKIGHGIGWPTMIAAGATRMNFWRFLSINLGVSLIKTGVLIFLGYYYGESYNVLSNYIHYGGLILSALLIGGIIAYILWKSRGRQNRQSR